MQNQTKMKFQITTKDRYGRVTAIHFAHYDTLKEAEEFAARMAKAYVEVMPNRNVSYIVEPADTVEKPKRKDFTRPFDGNLVLFDSKGYLKALEPYVDQLEVQLNLNPN